MTMATLTGGLSAPLEQAQKAEPVEAPPEQQAIETVPGMTLVTNADGETYNVRDTDVQRELAAGSRVATDADYFKTSGTPGRVIAAGLGAAQGASFDFGVPAAVAAAHAVGGENFGEGVRRGFSAAKEAYPGTYLGGEVVGSLAGAFALPGGAAKAVQGESALARAFARASAIAPRAAGEGAAFGVGNQLTEDTLGDHQATAQKLLASATNGAVFGALLGGAFAAGGGALGDVARGLAPKGGTAAETEAYRAAGGARTQEESGGAMKWLADKMKATAEEQAFKSTGAKTGAIEKLGANAKEQSEEARRLGRVILDEVGVGPMTTKGEMGDRVEAKIEQTWKDLHELRAPLDKSAIRPSIQNIITKADADIVQPLTGRSLAELSAGMKPNGGGLYGDIEAAPAIDALARLEARAGDTPSFESLFSLRRDLDNQLKKAFARGPGPRPPGEEALLKLRGIVEDEYMRAGEEAAKEIGSDFATKYVMKKSLYSDLKTVQGVLAKEVPRGLSNRSVSLTDTIAGAGGLTTAAAAIMAGHPIGALAAAAPLVNKAIRTYGNQAAAFVLNKAAQLDAIRRVSASFDENVTAGARAFVRGGEKAAASPAPKAKVTAETAQRIRDVAANPSALRAHVEGVIAGSGLRDNAPSVAQALATTTIRAATYLASKAPVDPPRQGLAFTPLPPRPSAATDMQRFQDVVDAVNDPKSVIDDLKKGRLNRDKIEALKNVYPQIYEKLRGEMNSQLVELKPSLTDQQEIALSILFNTPVNAMMRPGNIRGFSQAFAQGVNQAQTAQASGQPSGPRRPLTKSPGLASGMDRIEGSNAG